MILLDALSEILITNSLKTDGSDSTSDKITYQFGFNSIVFIQQIPSASMSLFWVLLVSQNEEIGLVWCSQAELSVVVGPFSPFWPCAGVDSQEGGHRGEPRNHQRCAESRRRNDCFAESPWNNCGGETAKRRHP